MAHTELDNIIHYWSKKYPNVEVTLMSNHSGDKYFGQMMGALDSVNLRADTIGELIGQGEAFLRASSGNCR